MQTNTNKKVESRALPQEPLSMSVEEADGFLADDANAQNNYGIFRYMHIIY